jgi:hypothetical protein
MVTVATDRQSVCHTARGVPWLRARQATVTRERDSPSLPDDATDDRGLPQLQLIASPQVEADPDTASDCALDRAYSLADRIREGDPVVGVPPTEGDRVATEPIAGTRPRGETGAADADLEADLRADENQRAEHAMLVDPERNDLGEVCAFRSVEVSEHQETLDEARALVDAVDEALASRASMGVRE